MSKTKSTWELDQEIQYLKTKIEDLEETIKDLLPMAQVYGTYKGHDNRDVPCVITNAFPRAGTIDIVVFDNQYSGGKTEITCDIGDGRGEARPYLKPKKPRVVNLSEAAESNEQLVAS
jgi:hypothetical protein